MKLKFIFILSILSLNCFSAPYILVGDGIYNQGRCQVFFLNEEFSKKLWVISFPLNEGEETPINDLVANQENYAGMGEIVDLAAKGFEEMKGFKLFISSMGEKVRYSITTKSKKLVLESSLTCQ
jgi:hypothetical protein